MNSPQATILVVDDTPENLELMSGLLKDLYRVRVANNGERALKLAAAHPAPDLVLLDVMMPHKTGFEVCQAVRADTALQATKILMLTAKGRETDVAKGLALGANAYMTKPFSTRELVQKVADLLGRPSEGAA